MSENTLILKGSGTEYPARFEKQEVRYPILDPVAGDPHATLDRFLSDFAAPDLTAEQQAQLVADYLNGYGLTYYRNGVAKRWLNTDENVKDLSPEEAAAGASKAAAEARVGVVAKKGSGVGRKSKKVKEAEAARDTALDSLRETYAMLPPAARKQMRKKLLDRGAPFTEELLDEWEAAA